jgi:hypothetical protein
MTKIKTDPKIYLQILIEYIKSEQEKADKGFELYTLLHIEKLLQDVSGELLKLSSPRNIPLENPRNLYPPVPQSDGTVHGIPSEIE